MSETPEPYVASSDDWLALRRVELLDGPWTIVEQDGYVEIKSADPIIEHIATIYGAIGQPYSPALMACARLFITAPDLLDALVKLSNEVLGSLPLMEFDARQMIGNSNYSILIQRANEARAAVAKATGNAFASAQSSEDASDV